MEDSLGLQWSGPVAFERDAVRRSVPDLPGVYKVVQTPNYYRYRGNTEILEIGKSLKLRSEVLRHFGQHTVVNRLKRIRNQGAVAVQVLWKDLPAELATKIESLLLEEFEDEHWELPALNSHRGYRRNKDSPLAL